MIFISFDMTANRTNEKKTSTASNEKIILSINTKFVKTDF